MRVERKFSPRRVRLEFVAQTITAVFGDAPKLAASGQFRLADGKQTFAALRELRDEWTSATDADEPMFTQSLIDVFETGVDCQTVEFEDDDDDIVLAWATSSHDLESNKYKPSSLRDMVEVARRYRLRVPGGSWTDVQAKLETIYGQKKRMYVYRMVVAAQMVSEPVLVALEKAKLPPSMIHENKYFVGGSIDQAKRLTEKGRLAVIAMVEGDMDQGMSVNAEQFKQEYCLPVRHAEVWLQSKARKYGELTNGLPSFRRLGHWLMSRAARIPVLAHIKAGRKLEGTGAPDTGIEQCRAVAEELEKALAAAAKSSAEGPSAEGNDADGTGSTPNEGVVGGTGSTPKEEVEGSVECTYMEDVPREEDPALVIAKAKTDIELSDITYHREWQSLHSDLPSSVMPQQRLLALVGAPTSKPRIMLKLIDQTVNLFKLLKTKKLKMCVPVGKRLDLAAAVQSKRTQSLVDMDCYVVQVTHGATQKNKRQPHYLLFAQSKADEIEVPVSIAALASRARPGEGTRLRCLDASCPWHPQEELGALLKTAEQEQVTVDKLAATCEINAEDMDCVAQDDLEDAGENNDEDKDAENLVEPVQPPPTGGKTLAADLWPFAFSKEYYKSIFNSLSPSIAPHHIVIASVSAFPGPVLAARELKACTHVLLDRVKEHSKAHADALCRAFVLTHFHTLEKAKQPEVKKRLRADSLNVIDASAPEQSDGVRFGDIAVGDEWRSGLDKQFPEQKLETLVPSLISRELDDTDSGTNECARTLADGTRRLVAARALKEGDSFMKASCLLFTDMDKVTEFLNTWGQFGSSARAHHPPEQLARRNGLAPNDLRSACRSSYVHWRLQGRRGTTQCRSGREALRRGQPWHSRVRGQNEDRYFCILFVSALASMSFSSCVAESACARECRFSKVFG